MTIRRLVHESGTLAKGKSGTYRVCLLSEGRGSSGEYPREAFTAEEAQKFAGALSFMNHPLDPEKPHLRPASDIVGRVGEEVVVEEHDGKRGFWADYAPSASKPQSTAFIAEYADALGLSIYIGAKGHQDNEGTFVVESFDGNDPYKSVDVVVAAGRGGKFERANEAYRSIETSLGLPADKPRVTSAQEQKEGSMDKEILEALQALKTSFDAFVTESKVAAKADAVAEADADAIDKAVGEALGTYDEKVTAIEAAKLLPSQVAALRVEARAGKDVAPLIESAKKIVDEAKAAVITESKVAEGFSLGAPGSDLTVAGWGN